MDYEVIKNIPDHIELQDEVIYGLWPEFMMHDLSQIITGWYGQFVLKLKNGIENML